MTDEQFSSLQSMVKQNLDDTAQIKRVLAGDEFHNLGLVQRMTAAEANIGSLYNYKAKVIAWAAGMSTALGGTTAWLVSIFKDPN